MRTRTQKIIETLHYINVAAAVGIITFLANTIVQAYLA